MIKNENDQKNTHMGCQKKKEEKKKKSSKF